MAASYRELTSFLRGLGTSRVAHTDGSFLAHLVGVYRLMKALGCDEELARAGLFHSIYGTEGFQKFCLPLSERSMVRQLIGAQAERLAYLNCAMDRSTFDRAVEQASGPYRIRDRFSREQLELADHEFDDLCRVHLIDFLEQVPRSRQWQLRRESFRHMAVRLGGAVEAAYERVFALEVA